MSHLINFNETKQTYSFATHQERAWHGLGQVVENAMTSEEAIKNANLDYEVFKANIYPKIDGDYGKEIPERFATIRKDTNDFLGIVSNRYEIVQNKDAFGFFDAIIDSKEAVFETAGALGNGERIFVTAKLPDDILVNGEPCNKYLILTNSHDGSSSIIAGFTTIRIVCNNTLQAALGGLSNKVSIQHKLGAKEKLSEAHKVMGMASKYMLEVEEIFNEFSKKQVNDEQLKDYIQKVMMPDTKHLQSKEEKEELSTRFKNQCDAIYEFALSHPTQVTNAAKGTLWGAYNSISGYYNYLHKFKTQEDKFKSQYFGLGNQRINKAFKLASELV